MSMPPRRRTSAVAGPVAAVGIAVAGAALIAVLNGVFTVSFGLLAIAGLAGYLIARAVVAGSAAAPSSRAALAILLADAMVVAGALGSWAFSLPQGGVLDPATYIAEAIGPLLAALIGAATLGAWAGSR